MSDVLDNYNQSKNVEYTRNVHGSQLLGSSSG